MIGEIPRTFEAALRHMGVTEGAIEAAASRRPRRRPLTEAETRLVEKARRVSDETLLAMARGARNGEKFSALYDLGELPEDKSASEKDASLVAMLAYWAGPDRDRIARLFDGSALYRDKTHSPRPGGDYLTRTIDVQLCKQTDFYRHSIPQARATRFRAFTVDEFLSQPRPPSLIKGFLPAKGVAAVFGASGAGKSFWVLELVAAIAAGSPWRGLKTKAGRVAYIVAEGAGGFRNRLEALQRRSGPASGLVVIPAAPDLRIDSDVDEVIALIENHGGARVVVVDTLAQTTPGANENSGEDMGPALMSCERIAAAFDALVIIVAHSGKDAARGLRGWSGIRAALDLEVEITRVGDARCATVTKSKDGEDGQKFPFQLARVELGRDEDGDPITSCTVEHLDEMPRPAVAIAKAPKGDAQKIAWAAFLERMDLSADPTVSEAEVISATAAQLDRGDGRDIRRQRARQAITGLVSGEFLVRDGADLRLKE